MRGEENYLFIDGAYLREVYRKNIAEFFGVAGDIDFDSIRRSVGAIRAFYYDCLDDVRRANESEADLQRRLCDQEDILSKIKSLTGFHLRLGTLSGSHKRLRQKQVDVMLAVEMLTHAFHKHMKQATLIAGDLDFKPIVDALVDLGTWVTVSCEPASAAEDLYSAADQRCVINLRKLYEWSSEAFRGHYQIPLVQGGTKAPTGLTVLRKGRLKGSPAAIYKSGNGFLFSAEGESRAASLSALYDDLPKLEKYLEMVHGRVEWDPS
jgi:uncharacterized LabA/DUF88 family protein